MKFLLSSAFYIFTLQLSSQAITVDNTKTEGELVTILAGNSCATISNVSISSDESVVYFDQNGSTFPINEGVLIRSGIALETQGPYTGTNLSTTINTDTDTDLQQISDDSGQKSTITDVAFLEFEFNSPSTNFSFNFLFASNEYGEYQCNFSDVFAFILTDLDTDEKTNLAVIPASGNPISTREIRDTQYNTTCSSSNVALFDTYNVDTPNNSTLNMRGHTVVMNASSIIKPNHSYKIKLVIGDYGDSTFDSAVFIEAGTFGDSLSLGEDFSICNGEVVTLNSGFINTTDYTYEWRRDNTVIPGETNPSVNITSAGIYDLKITNNNGSTCDVEDQIIVSGLTINNPPNLSECDTGETLYFDLTQNNINTLVADPTIDLTKYSLSYFSSEEDITNENPISTALLTAYESTGGETIYGVITNINSVSSCTQNINFELIANLVTATKPNDFAICRGGFIDLSAEVGDQILNGLNSLPNNLIDPPPYSISYFTSLLDAQNNLNAINSEDYNFSLPTTFFTLWARLIDNNQVECFDITDFNITVNTTPPVDFLPTILKCSEHVLEPLTNGKYFTESGGTGIMLNPKDTINESTSLYIFAVENGCFSETSFEINFIDEYEIVERNCGQFNVPRLAIGDFYSAPGGPAGTGSIIPPNTVITVDQSIYYYATLNGIFCTETRFDLVILPLPEIDTLTDVTTCLKYALPALTNGYYFTEANGQGVRLKDGDEINTEDIHTIYIYNTSGANACTNETSFQLTIIDTSIFIDQPPFCGVYLIPDTFAGGFFTQSNGLGDQFNVGDEITTIQTIYFYAPTTDGCADDVPMLITVYPLPAVDSLEDVLTCVDVPYTLPVLTNGKYFTEPNSEGTPLKEGDVFAIPQEQTIYIYIFDGDCPNETNFTVTVRPLPPLDSFNNVLECDPTHELPLLNSGKYYTEANAQGTELLPGDLINSNQTIYVYNQYNDLATCTNEAFYQIEFIGVVVDRLEDVKSCDSYILPVLTSGSYFTEANEQGTPLEDGYPITTTQTLYIFKDNNRPRNYCYDESSFTITISTTPVLPTYPDIVRCGSYTLPDLTLGGSIINYYREPNQEGLITTSEYLITTTDTVITETIYVYAYASDNENCFDETQFDVTIYPLLNLEVEDGIICVNYETKETVDPYFIESGLNPLEFTVEWYFDNQLVGTGPNYTATKAGTYTIRTIKLTPDIVPFCNYNPKEVVIRASIPNPKVTFLTSAFEAPASIKIDFIEEGFGEYQYKLNDGEYQTRNVFNDLDFGEYTVYVKDVSGICSDELSIPFKVINRPLFFSPNNDGENDTWNIPDLINRPEAKISVFNKYGKLITVIRPTDVGWDGNYDNGSKAPSTDYWFKAEFIYDGNPIIYSSNFSLIRRE
jgi:gliding motility-associated-like protein